MKKILKTKIEDEISVLKTAIESLGLELQDDGSIYDPHEHRMCDLFDESNWLGYASIHSVEELGKIRCFSPPMLIPMLINIQNPYFGVKTIEELKIKLDLENC